MQRKKRSAKKTKAKSKSSARAKKSGARRARPQLRLAPNDIVQLILEDHKPIKECIEKLKSEDTELAEKRQVFLEFARILPAHSKPEEQSLYLHMKGWESLRKGAYEGDTEHTLADLLMNEIKSTEDEAVWEARAKVLAEIVEHHIEEEEGEMLKQVRKELSEEERAEIGDEYIRLREEFVPAELVA